MHAYNGCLFDQGFVRGRLVVRHQRRRPLTRLFDSAELSKACDDQVPDLLVVGVAGHEEHVPSDALHEHLLSSDPIRAQSEEHPREVSTYNHVASRVSFTKSIKEIKYPFLDKDVDRLLVECKVHESQ